MVIAKSKLRLAFEIQMTRKLLESGQRISCTSRSRLTFLPPSSFARWCW